MDTKLQVQGQIQSEAEGDKLKNGVAANLVVGAKSSQPRTGIHAGKLYKMRKDFRKNWVLLLFTLPFVIFTFIFSYIPMAGVTIAFKHFMYNVGFLNSPWVGFDNFKFFFTSPDAWRITRNTLGYNAIFIITGLITAIVVALLLYEITNKAFLKTYQTILFIPYFISWVVVAFMVYAFLNSRSGMLNLFLKNAGLEPIDWYNKTLPWVFILPIANLWKGVGMNALIYYASLVGIDPEYFEAARIEGASKLQITMKITLPFLYPLMSILTILAIGSIFSSDFGLFYQLTMDSAIIYPVTDVLDTYLYRALRLGNIDISSAAGLYKSFVGFVLVIAANRIVKKIDPEYSLF